MAATPGPPKNAPQYTEAQVIAAITSAANKYGVPPEVLIAAAKVESGLNPNTPGGGLFQDIVGGEAGNAIFKGNPQNVYNLALSAENAAQTFAAAAQQNPGADWGTISAKAQRPLDPIKYAAAVNSQLGGSTNATLGSAVTTTPTLPATKDAPVIAGANVKNFHGYDLSAIPANQLGNAEKAINDYIAHPNAVDRNGLTLEGRLQKDFQYTTSFIDKLPPAQRAQVKAVLVWAAQNLDNADPASKAQFLSAIGQTDWWKTTSQYQRAWQNELGADPASAQKALQVAQDKVLATANQIGVRLSPAQLHQIANAYAAQSYTPTGTYSSQSGTSQEWLDQAVLNAVTQVKNGSSALESTSPTDLTGIAGQLYNQFQNIAQQYLMYSKGGNGLLTDANLMGYVNDALKTYTGSGSFGSSNLINGAVQSFTQQMVEKATQMYPSLAGPISQGTTPQQYTQPEANLIANTLGLDSASIDFTSPNWNWAIATPDPKTNTKTALTQDQILQKITNPNFTFQGPGGQTMTYNNTNNAVQTANSMTSSLGRIFGTGGQ